MAFINALGEQAEGFIKLIVKPNGGYALYISRNCNLSDEPVDIQVDTDTHMVRLRNDPDGLPIPKTSGVGASYPTLAPLHKTVRRIGLRKSADGWWYGDYGKAL